MTLETPSQSEWTTRKLLDWTLGYLDRSGVESPRLCAEMLLAHVLGCQRIDLYVQFDHCPTDSQRAAFKALFKRCAEHEPVAYLTGKAHFYNLELKVSSAVLIPRPETELLVVAALDFLKQINMDRQYGSSRPHAKEQPKVLDLCCGSGCIALALATNAPDASILATDHCNEALKIAWENLETHQLTHQVHLRQSDLYADLKPDPEHWFDLIVSNPPYISQADYEKLAPVVRDYEPQQALLGGEDGLDYLRRIISDGNAHLQPGGALMLEIAYNQGQDVISLLEQSGSLNNIETHKDHQGHERIITARKK
jgi:release factor glutamine methyltransferase